VTQPNEFTILEWLLILGVTALAIAVSELIGLPHHWKDAAVYTVVVFAVVILALRAAWDRAAFWRSLALVFAGHTIVVLVAVQALPHGRLGFPKLLLIPIGGVEGVLIAALLRRRMAALDTRFRRHI
jgi:hypothetical protein